LANGISIRPLELVSWITLDDVGVHMRLGLIAGSLLLFLVGLGIAVSAIPPKRPQLPLPAFTCLEGAFALG
jgi:hypothetical protein